RLTAAETRHADVSFRAAGPAAGGRSTAVGGARVPAVHAPRPLRAQARALVGRLRSRVQLESRRPRLDRPDVAQEIWRPRAVRARALRDARGDAGRRRARLRPLDRRPAERPALAALRD